MENDDIARLTAALRTVGAELDALSHRVDALRRSLETLLFEGPR